MELILNICKEGNKGKRNRTKFFTFIIYEPDSHAAGYFNNQTKYTKRNINTTKRQPSMGTKIYLRLIYAEVWGHAHCESHIHYSIITTEGV